MENGLIQVGRTHSWVFPTEGGQYKLSTQAVMDSVNINSKMCMLLGRDFMVFVSGKWRHISEESMIHLVDSIVKRNLKKVGGKKYQVSGSVINTIVSYGRAEMEPWPSSSDIQKVLSDGTYKVITKDTVYRIYTNGTVDTVQNTGQYFNGACLPNFSLDVPLNEDILQFLHSITLGQQDYIDYIQEMFGNIILNQHDPEPYIYLLSGSGKNGKSAFLKLINFMVAQQFSSVEFANINEQNAFLFEQVYVNCPTELGERSFSSAILKAIVSGDPVGVNEKYKSPRTIIPMASMVGSANKLPSIPDTSYGMWRRIQILPFLLKITKKNQIDEVDLMKLFSDNVEGIRSWGFQGLLRFITNRGKHSSCVVIKEASKQYKDEENSVMTFIKDFLFEVVEHCTDGYDFKTLFDGYSTGQKKLVGEQGNRDGAFRIRIRDLYNAYTCWSKKYGFKTFNVKNFKEKLFSESNDYIQKDILLNGEAVYCNILAFKIDMKLGRIEVEVVENTTKQKVESVEMNYDTDLIDFIEKMEVLDGK